MSTSFHPQTDGQTEYVNHNIGQILQVVVNHDQKNWVDKIDMVEFVINLSISETTGYFPFKLNYRYMPLMIKKIHNDKIILQGIKAFALLHCRTWLMPHNVIIEAWNFQTHAANKLRKKEPWISIGDLIYLCTKNLNLPKGRAWKLCPKFVGPFKVEPSNYILELPTVLQVWNIFPKFHVSLLCPYYASSDTLFPNSLQPKPYDFGISENQECFVDNIISYWWTSPRQIKY